MHVCERRRRGKNTIWMRSRRELPPPEHGLPLRLERGASFSGILRRKADGLQIAFVLDSPFERHAERGAPIDPGGFRGDWRAGGSRFRERTGTDNEVRLRHDLADESPWGA